MSNNQKYDSNYFEILDEFKAIVDSVCGVYYDGTHGFHLARQKMEDMQKINLGTIFNESDEINKVEDLDSKIHHYGNGDPNDPNTKFLHQCTQGDFKDRNREGGKNFIFWLMSA